MGYAMTGDEARWDPKRKIRDSRGVPVDVASLRNLSDEELDEAIRGSSHTLAGGDILDEYARREARRQTAEVVSLTSQIRWWTIVVVLATLVTSRCSSGTCCERPAPRPLP
jgi:hypothetical protein